MPIICGGVLVLVSLVYGFFLGALTIGSTTYRTIKVIEGNIPATAWSSLVHSALYFAAMKQIIDNDIYGYAGFSLGAGLSTCWLAYKQRKK